MKLWPLLVVVRWQNLLLIAVTQLLVRYFLFIPFHISVSLGDLQFVLLVLATVSIAAAGNIISAISNVFSDSINKPDHVIIGQALSEKSAFNWFFALNILGVGLGFYLANYIDQPAFSAFFILPSALLYLYAVYLKKIPFIGNLTASLLLGLVLLNVGIFDLLPAITPRNLATQQVLFSILIDYAIFACLINLLLEIVKDQKDAKGDHNAGIPTLSVLLGTDRTNKLIFLLALLPITALIYYIYTYLFHNQAAVLYVLLLMVAPLLYFQTRIWKATSQKDFTLLSMLLKGVLLAGILSLGLYRFILL